MPLAFTSLPMKHLFSLLILLTGMQLYAQKTFDYPSTPKDSILDHYFDETVEDPYQWMENPEDPRLNSWLEQQKKLTDKLSNDQTRIWDLRAQIVSMFRNTRREKTDDYVERDDKLEDKYDFDQKWSGFHNSLELLYKLKDKKNYRRLFNARDLVENKDDHIMIQKMSVNEEDNLLAVSLSINGSDWASGYVFDLATGKQLPVKLENLKQSRLEWHNKTLYYSSFDKPVEGRELLDKATGQKLLNLDLAEENPVPTVLYRNPDTTGVNPFRFTVDQDYLQLYHFLKSKETWYRAISVADLNQEQFQPRRFLVYPNEENAQLSIVHRKNDSIFLKTNMGAPNGKILLANLNTPNKLSEFVPEYDINLDYVNKLGKDKIACVYLNEGQNIALIYNLKGELLRKIDFPKGKRLSGFYEESDDAEITSFSINSFFHPALWYQISLEDLNFKPIESVSVPYDIDNLETKYITYTSKDGTQVPMYITYDKETKLDGTNPVLMYGYGGYGSTVEPRFDHSTGLLLAHGGIYAVPGIRGGGAKGEEWAVEGRKLKKQNAIDDFIAAAEYLINENYTNPDKLIISGTSHGGMLIAASMTQRPDLFKAAIAEAGVYDMLRASKFTSGAVNTNLNEFGTPENIEDYKNLKSYSPLHHIEKGTKYPNLLLFTGDTDDRVPPHHSYKFLAKMQEYGDPEALYHMYITPGSGHAGGLTPEDRIEKMLFEYYFIFDQLDIDFF